MNVKSEKYEEVFGDVEMLPRKTSGSENGTNETKSLSVKNNTTDVLNENHTLVYKSSSEILKEGILDSMTYADNSMFELQTRMEGLFSNEPEPEIRRFDPERVATAAMCARTIADIIRAKTEAMKLLAKGRDE